MISLAQSITKYQEDVSTLATGTELIGGPCRVFAIIVSSETTGVGTVSFSNTITSYAAASRVGKITLSGATTQAICYPTGKYFSTGVCVTANKASMDVEIIYE